MLSSEPACRSPPGRARTVLRLAGWIVTVKNPAPKQDLRRTPVLLVVLLCVLSASAGGEPIWASMRVTPGVLKLAATRATEGAREPDGPLGRATAGCRWPSLHMRELLLGRPCRSSFSPGFCDVGEHTPAKDEAGPRGCRGSAPDRS